MATYLTRVELHGATQADYQTLHHAMTRSGFQTTIRSDDGKIYQLPTAEYVSTSPLTVSQVRDLARTAANTTGKGSWILTAEYTAASWYLQEA